MHIFGIMNKKKKKKNLLIDSLQLALVNFRFDNEETFHSQLESIEAKKYTNYLLDKP